MSWYIGLGRTSCENETWSSHRSSRPYGTVRVPDMDPPPSSAISLFILVDLNIDVAITSYSTRIAGFLCVVLYVCTHSSTVLRYDTVLLEYTSRTILYLHCLQDLEEQKLYHLYSYEHGEYCLKYSTVRVQCSRVQSRTRTSTSTSKRGA